MMPCIWPLKKDTDKIIEPQQGTDYFFVRLHDDVNSRADTFVHKLWKQQQNKLSHIQTFYHLLPKSKWKPLMFLPVSVRLLAKNLLHHHFIESPRKFW